ncbi:MAG TPA: Uma2 family endonuclease [Planctomycetaceae bacterium]|nr:Uma2 family endonuclease [Planctomycetaceae bacterium]HQZ68800.1 Uma2 family endonuclease [Planctomycetaceae bacterium]
MQVISNAAVAGNFSDILTELGGISADRVHHTPGPGSATIEDLRYANENGALCELIDGTLVEKAMGWQESLVAAYLIELIGSFSRLHNLGLVTGPDGFVRILGSLVRGPDVAFVSWDRLPNRRMPVASVPECVPDLAVEVLSLGNTLAEMSRKRREYFHAGVRLVWMIDPRERTVAVYTSITNVSVIGETGKLSGGDVLPRLEIDLAELFAELDRQPPE